MIPGIQWQPKKKITIKNFNDMDLDSPGTLIQARNHCANTYESQTAEPPGLPPGDRLELDPIWRHRARNKRAEMHSSY